MAEWALRRCIESQEILKDTLKAGLVPPSVGTVGHSLLILHLPQSGWWPQAMPFGTRTLNIQPVTLCWGHKLELLDCGLRQRR